jgi:hypothetical protein
MRDSVAIGRLVERAIVNKNDLELSSTGGEIDEDRVSKCVKGRTDGEERKKEVLWCTTLIRWPL